MPIPGASGHNRRAATDIDKFSKGAKLSSPAITLSPLLYTRLNYDPHKDLAPIALVGAVHNLLLVHPSVPVKTLQELAQIARNNPGKLNYGSGGVGTTSHLAPEEFAGFIRSEAARFGKVIKEAGIKGD